MTSSAGGGADEQPVEPRHMRGPVPLTDATASTAATVVVVTCTCVTGRGAGSCRPAEGRQGGGRLARRAERRWRVDVHALDAVEGSQILRTAGPEVPEPVPPWVIIITTTYCLS